MMIVILLAAWVGVDVSWEQEADRERYVNKEQREREELESFFYVGGK